MGGSSSRTATRRNAGRRARSGTRRSRSYASFDRLEKLRYNIRASAGAKKINGEDEDEDESAPKNKAVSLSENALISSFASCI